MIRFVDLGTQIDEHAPHFAWWDTMHDCFISYLGEFAWESWEEFAEGLLAAGLGQHMGSFRALMPTDWPGASPERERAPLSGPP